jgi:hypothetical protein
MTEHVQRGTHVTKNRVDSRLMFQLGVRKESEWLV